MRFLVLFLFTVAALSCRTENQVNRSNANVNNSTVNVNKPVNSNADSNTQTAGKIPVYTYEIVNTFKHDPKAFTEGLFFYNGFLYESTGEISSLRKVELQSGNVVQKFDLPKESFGEGITKFGDKIYQLTWQEGICRVFDAESFKLLKELRYQGDGWGLTNDGKNIIMTDSTHVIRFIDPETFNGSHCSVFREDGQPLMNINELEYIKGEIWANIWHSEDPNILGKPNYIVRIDPKTGKILGWIDLGGISPDDSQRDPENTLNGIAYDEATDRIFVTGKNWKKLFEIKVIPKQ